MMRSGLGVGRKEKKKDNTSIYLRKSKINGGVLEVVMGVVVWISHPTLFGYRKSLFLQTWSFERLWRRRQEISVLISNPCPNYPAEYCQVCANRNFKSK